MPSLSESRDVGTCNVGPLKDCKGYKRIHKGESSLDSSDALTRPGESSKRQRRFESEMFALYVGPGRQLLSAHAAILSKSPVFKRMCNGPFLELETKTINLPDDDPDLIHLMLECLYSTHDSCSRPDLDFVKRACREAGISFLKHLAELYIVSDKYQLVGIQTSIVDIYATKRICTENVPIFLTVSERIYGNIATSNGPFPKWFRAVAPETFDWATPEQLKILRNLVRGGDDLAADIFTAMSLAHGVVIDVGP